MSREIKYSTLFFKCYKMWEKLLNIDFENAIPCINLFLMYILKYLQILKKKIFLTKSVFRDIHHYRFSLVVNHVMIMLQ